MKYYILAHDNALTEKVRAYEKALEAVQKKWNALGSSFDTTLVSEEGVAVGFLNPSDSCDAELTDKWYYVPFEGSELEEQVNALPHYPQNTVAAIMAGYFTDADQTFVMMHTTLGEDETCHEISEALYYDAKTNVTGVKTRAVRVCPICGNNMLTPEDSSCFRCGREV